MVVNVHLRHTKARFPVNAEAQHTLLACALVRRPVAALTISRAVLCNFACCAPQRGLLVTHQTGGLLFVVFLFLVRLLLVLFRGAGLFHQKTLAGSEFLCSAAKYYLFSVVFRRRVQLPNHQDLF
jgi:hypothetical protein